MHERRHNCGQDDGLVRQPEEFDHQKRCCAHHRRRDLAAGRRGRLDRRCKVARIPDADHGRDRQRTHGDRIGNRRSRQHAEHRRAEHRDLGRSARILARNRGGNVKKQPPQPDARGQHAEQHEMKYISRHHAHRDAVDALARQVLMIDDLAPVIAGVPEQSGERAACQRIHHEDDGDHRQWPAHRAPRRLQQRDDQDRPHDHVERLRVADPERQVVEDVRHIQHRHRYRDAESPVGKRHPTGRRPR